MSKILIVEDEPDMVTGLRDNFELEGYKVIVARDGAEGLKKALEEKPDLIVLDLMLPKMSGLDVCRSLRKSSFDAPILMLTARGQELDKVLGLEVGADDYITKPFSLNELLARVRAHLRRATHEVATIEHYAFGDVAVDFQKFKASKNNLPIEISPREFELLKFLVNHRGETVTREQLLDAVWGYDAMMFTRTVDNHIAKLRQKIEADPENPVFILTVHRVGYRFVS
jgi:two-component system alkaline phosphatase synthesis response regulator PhoP